MAKDLEEALVNPKVKLGGEEKPPMDLGGHLEYIESLLEQGAGGGGIKSVSIDSETMTRNASQVDVTKDKIIIVTDASGNSLGIASYFDDDGEPSGYSIIIKTPYPYAGNFANSFEYITYILKLDGTIDIIYEGYYYDDVDESMTFFNESMISGADNYRVTSLVVPALPSDASTKNYTLNSVNGTLTWQATGSGGGGKSVPPTLNLIDFEKGGLRTTITEEEKTNLENGLYNQVIFFDSIPDEAQPFVPSKIVGDKSLGVNMFAQFKFVAGDTQAITAISFFGYSFGAKDTNGNYPITIEKRFELPIGGSGGVTVTFED